MNNEYMYMDNQVVVTSCDGTITLRENNTNIEKILEVENKIEGLENDINNTKYKIESCYAIKKNLRDASWLAIALWPALMIALYNIGTSMVTSITEAITVGASYSTITLVAIYSINHFTNKEIKTNKKLLSKQIFQQSKEKEKLRELIFTSKKVNDKTKEDIRKMDLQKLKEYRAQIIANHYFDTNKAKIMKLKSKGKLRDKFLIDYNNEYIYSHLEDLSESENNKVKILSSKK